MGGGGGFKYDCLAESKDGDVAICLFEELTPNHSILYYFNSKEDFLKTLWEKKKRLVTRMFSTLVTKMFSPFPLFIVDLLSHIYFVIYNCFHFGSF